MAEDRPGHIDPGHDLDAAFVQAALGLLAPATQVVTSAPRTAALLREAGRETVLVDRLPRDLEAPVDTIGLLDDELSRVGEHAERLVAEVADLLRPGGLLVASGIGGAVLHDAEGDAPRRYTAAGFRHLFEHRGFSVQHLAAPGVARLLRGREGVGDAELDRSPGLLDAGSRLLIAARAPRSAGERSARFLATLPRKVVSAATVTCDAAGRLLVVFDSFRGHWTIPGGIVDADEDPRLAAVRETWEEAGVRVGAGPLLGVFAASWPDRLMLAYEGRPQEADPRPDPVHTHEVSEARFVDLDDALRLLNPRAAEQVRRCLDTPGNSWTE